jgi:hypothetical protein
MDARIKSGHDECVSQGELKERFAHTNFNFKQSRGQICPRFAGNFLTLRSEGAGNTGCTLHPRSRVQQCTRETHTSIQVHRRQSGIPCAMVLTGSFVLSPATGLVCHRRLRKLPFANLTPASGRQDHTTSPSTSSAFVYSAISVHRIPPRIRDDHDTPLGGAGHD